MAGFDYGNARLRAMKSRLLTRRDYESLAGAGSVSGLITLLAKTAYRKPVEMALARSTGMDCINEALRTDMINTIGKIGGFYSERSGNIVGLVLRTYDLHNITAILRGLRNNITPDMILATFVPVGELDIHTLTALAGAPGVRAAIDMMVSMYLPFALPLMRLRSEQPGAGVQQMELALQRWYFQQAQSYASEIPDAEWFKAALNLDADLINLRTILRFVHDPEERETISEQPGILRIRNLFVGPGKLPFNLLDRLIQQDDLEKAVELLSSTAYNTAMRLGLEAYRASGRLSDFERSLNRYRLIWMSSLIKRNPLGIGLILGFTALKVNEISNLRWIANGINLGLNTGEIQKHLEIVL